MRAAGPQGKADACLTPWSAASSPLSGEAAEAKDRWKARAGSCWALSDPLAEPAVSPFCDRSITDPFQRDLSQTHHASRRFIDRTGLFLDPVIASRARQGL